MLPASVSNSTSLSEEASASSSIRAQDLSCLSNMYPDILPQEPLRIKKKRNLPGNPDPDAEVIALSPRSLMATNRFVCEICNKGFQRDQNLQLHRRGHNLPWKLKQRSTEEIRKKVYVCPESTCVHHNPSRALGDLTGIKKHFCRKHGEKKWRCTNCTKKYAVYSDWKAHTKTCGTREYNCQNCGAIFPRRDSFVTHRAFCDALAQESVRFSSNPPTNPTTDHSLHLHPQNLTADHSLPLHPQNPSPLYPFSTQDQHHLFQNQSPHIPSTTSWDIPQNLNSSSNTFQIKPESHHQNATISPLFFPEPPPPLPQHRSLITSPYLLDTHMNSNTINSPHLSATGLLQQAANIGATAAPITGGLATQTESVGHMASSSSSSMTRLAMNELGTASHMGNGISPEYMGFNSESFDAWQKNDRMTRNFLGLAAAGGESVSNNVRDLMSFTGAVDFPTYDRDHSLLKPNGFGFSENWGGNC